MNCRHGKVTLSLLILLDVCGSNAGTTYLTSKVPRRKLSQTRRRRHNCPRTLSDVLKTNIVHVILCMSSNLSKYLISTNPLQTETIV